MTNYLLHAMTLLLAYAWFSATAFAAATMPPQFNANSMTTGWVGEVEFTSFDFSSGSECLIKADYIKADSSGAVYAIPVEPNGNLQLAASCWSNDFAEAVNIQAASGTRLIGTMNSDGTRIPFQWANLHKDRQKKSLGDDKIGPKIVAYVRGDRSNEEPNGEKYRARGDTVLGDIIHSRPLYVAHPTAPRVYVGANDGMLHAIDACVGCETSGTEAWAYLPSFFINGDPESLTKSDKPSSLATLANPASPYPHRYFVDATPNARKIPASTVGSGQSAAIADKTILVSGVGPGSTAKQNDGKLVNKYENDPTKNAVTGMFALDITNPVAINEQEVADKIMWEITNTSINNTNDQASYPQLGQTYGVPLIVKMNDGNWATVVGNGYSQADGGTGQAYLYVINLATGAKIAQILATIAGAADDGHPNGLSSPTAIDTDHDGDIDFVYAGDLGGNLWKFDLRSSSASSWTAFKLFSTPNANTTTGRAITGAPSVALHPKGGYMIMFGTGRAFTNTGTTSATVLNDLTNTTQQYVYGVWDTDFPASGTALSRTIDSTKLVDQTLSSPISITSSNGLPHTVRTNAAINAVDYNPGTGQKHGWRLPLAVNATDSATTTVNAERVLGDGGLIAAGRYHVTISNPNFDNGTTGGLANARGDNWLLEVDYLTGTAPLKPIFDLNMDTSLDNSDLVPDTGQASAQLRIPVARRIARGGLLSQPVLAQLEANGQTYFNLNPDLAFTVTPNTAGVSSGHFDFDIYWPACTPSSGGYKCSHNTHVHEYDDKYNVTGVNMQNASLTAFNLKNAVGVGQKFKIIVANQFLSPAVKLRIGDADAAYRPVFNFLTPTDPTYPTGVPNLGTGTVLGTNTPFSDLLPVYSRGGVPGTTLLAHMVLNMPLNAFSQLDWVSGSTASCDPATNANCRVGLIPTQTGCVRSNKLGFTDVNPPTSLLPFGNLWMNGAMTIQVIKDTTPDSAIRVANSAGDKKFGYRLKSDSVSQQNQLAQYTIFWHHPNGKCYGDSGWGTTAAIAYPDTSGKASAQTPAPGSDDPKDGVFEGPGGGSEEGPPESGGPPAGTPYTYTTPDGQTYTQYVLTNADGTVTITVVGPDGQSEVQTFPPGQGPIEGRRDIKSGRQAWKQMMKP